ncbi:hypothetical protein [Bifidobacterium eulemuris]|uniref:Uncharacterized protein n=1 Tax=Bifidobacterium eulemuris TaxID=1765219 RepID=A0A261GDV7_9BIFI|nr:hypothetical protein [Bifidobacterium eulemuris]OZG69600.1 hypothetical protein BEUL_0017 [Bifidobacterium eulemuris]QOL32283.1 hypothetical protein BE0216_07305 [Bifidobacterium eulemuris]
MAQPENYNPMIYDAMRESANRLVGEYTYLANRTDDMVMRNALLDAIRGVRQEVTMTDADSRKDVEAKTAEFASRAANMRNFRINGAQMARDHMATSAMARPAKQSQEQML